MSLWNDLVDLVDDLRNIAGPSELDQIAQQVTIRTRTWSGAVKGLGTRTDVDLVLPQKFRVVDLHTAEINSSGGRYEMGDIRVKHITPYNGSVGFTEAQLKPPITTNNQEVLYVISGRSHAGEYSLVELRSWRNYSWEIVLRRRITTP